MNEGIDAAIARGPAYAPYADMLWCETSTPDLDEAKAFAEAVHAEFPGKLLAYNCSPSFNWRTHLDDAQIATFQKELGAMGYRFQFITLAGFHALNASMFELARGLRRRRDERLRGAPVARVRAGGRRLHRGEAPGRGRHRLVRPRVADGRPRARPRRSRWRAAPKPTSSRLARVTALHGAIAAAVTPMRDGGGAIDVASVAPLTAFLADGGVDGVLACGTTGEGVLLRVEERMEIARAFVAAAPDGFQVAVHAGAQTTQDTVTLAAPRARHGRGCRRGDRAAVLPARRRRAVRAPARRRGRVRPAAVLRLRVRGAQRVRDPGPGHRAPARRSARTWPG